MMDAVCSIPDLLQRRCSHDRHTSLSARAVCSIVTCGFFPPHPIGLLGDEQHHQLAEGHVPHQSAIAASLEVGKADLAFDDAEDVLNAPASERETGT